MDFLKNEFIIRMFVKVNPSALAINTYGLQFSGPDNLENLRKLAEQFQKQQPPTAGQPTQDDDDDEVPELVAGETFETVAEDSHT